jgi:hypothetical protein
MDNPKCLLIRFGDNDFWLGMELYGKFLLELNKYSCHRIVIDEAYIQKTFPIFMSLVHPNVSLEVFELPYPVLFNDESNEYIASHGFYSNGEWLYVSFEQDKSMTF